MRTLVWGFRKLPGWGKLLVILLLLGLFIYLVYLVITNIVYILLALLFAGGLLAFAKGGGSRHRDYDDYEGSRDIHIYHHKDKNSKSSGGFRANNSYLYAPKVNKKGVDFITGKRRR